MEKDKFWYTVYYKGESESPIRKGNYALYWSYEESYFRENENPNEEDFKNHMLQAIDKVSEYFMSFDKALNDYFDIEKQKNCR